MSRALHLFEAFGIELEYMIVDKKTLAVKPVADELLRKMAGSYSDFDNGMVTWSNELVLHVIEIKCTRPEGDLKALADAFHDNVQLINQVLARWDAMLCPTAAHPFMDPRIHTVLWPHDSNEIYSLYNKMFDCRGHGWSNLQSTHLNLPFSGDDEFGRLHAAIRVILPLLPALCASSTVLDGKLTEHLDARMTYYKTNQQSIPSITGFVIPEQVFSASEYEDLIYDRIAKDIARYNGEDILDPVWVNSRGAMARFDRGSVEIRVMDIQECAAADMGIQEFVIGLLKDLVHERWCSYDDQKKIKTEVLANILDDVIHSGMTVAVKDADWLRLFGFKKPCTVHDLISKVAGTNPVVQTILKEGNLSTRIRKALDGNNSPASINDTWHRLATCLNNNVMFKP
jgi:gamma-glutamyl:cysteine ligase YbdK (ATP-grasp superfamily)